MDGHYALLPLHIPHYDAPLQASDSLPCVGTRSCQVAIESLTQLAHALKFTRFHTRQAVAELLLADMWQEPGMLRQQMRTIAESLSSVAYVNIVDKSSAMLFGFCHQWVWEATIRFLSHEEYTHQSLSHATHIPQSLQRAIKKNA